MVDKQIDGRLMDVKSKLLNLIDSFLNGLVFVANVFVHIWGDSVILDKLVEEPRFRNANTSTRQRLNLLSRP